jgi:hypothetical protein
MTERETFYAGTEVPSYYQVPLDAAFVLASGFRPDPDDPDCYAALPHPDLTYPTTGVLESVDGRWS